MSYTREDAKQFVDDLERYYARDEVTGADESPVDSRPLVARQALDKIKFWYGNEDVEVPCDICGKPAVESLPGGLEMRMRFYCVDHRKERE